MGDEKKGEKGKEKKRPEMRFRIVREEVDGEVLHLLPGNFGSTSDALRHLRKSVGDKWPATEVYGVIQVTRSGIAPKVKTTTTVEL